MLRDGRWVMSRSLEGLTSDDLVRAMVGRELLERETDTNELGATVLQVERLSREGFFSDISFDVKAGDIVALAGLVGAGRSEVACSIFGIDRYDAGSVTVNGKRLRKASPTGAMAAGVGLVPEDRRQQGLVMEMAISRNIALPRSGVSVTSDSSCRPRAALRRGLGKAASAQVREALQSGHLALRRQPAEGRARQVARPEPSLLLIDEPTRGIDIATKAEVHRLLDELAGQGVAILMISSELPEVLSVADRILVMREGRLVVELAHAEASEETIVAAATGQLTQDAA